MNATVAKSAPAGPDSPEASNAAPSPARVGASMRHRLALRRWSRLAIALGTLGVVASEVAGSVWPVTFVTPLARKLAAMLALGAAGILFGGIGIPASGRRSASAVEENPGGVPNDTGEEVAAPETRARRVADTRWLIVAAVAGIYATLVALGALPWRDVPRLGVPTTGDANLGRLKILSANVHSSNLDRDALPALIVRERPDVIVLTELTSAWIGALKPLNDEYPVRQVVADDAGNFGLGVWSKLPGEAKLVVRQRLDKPSLLDVAHAEMTLTLDGHAVRIYGLHPLPPLTPAMLGARDALLRSIADDVAKSDVPTIVAGDLNATRYCRITRDVCRRAGLADAMPDVGTSWPMTLARPILGIRIDQILGDDAWRLVENHAGPTIGSDHLPMVATLQLTKGTR